MLVEQRFKCVERAFSDLKPRPQIGHSGRRGRGGGAGAGTREARFSRSSRHLDPIGRHKHVCIHYTTEQKLQSVMSATASGITG